MNATPAARRQLPFGSLVSTRTVWVVVGLWAPLGGLIMALADPSREKRPLSIESITANWDVLILLLIRLSVSCAAANKAFASRTRWRAMAWMASGAAIAVFLAPWQHLKPYDALPGGQWDPWEDIKTYAAIVAAWYSLFAFLLYRSAGRSSHEQADCAVGVAGLWVALPTLATYFTLTTDVLEGRELATMTCLLFGYRNFLSLRLGVHVALAGLLPIGVALLSVLRILGRRRWLRLVEDGRISGWRLVGATIPRPAGLPMLTGDGQGAVKVLVRSRNTTDPNHPDDEAVALVSGRSPTVRMGPISTGIAGAWD